MLPPPTAGFTAKKDRILDLLHRPEAEYVDASPKGSIDEAIRPLLAEINAAPGFVTTSSCAGRVAVFLQGRRAGPDSVQAPDEPDAGTGPGGKGPGGRWLYLSHQPLALEGPQACDALADAFGLPKANPSRGPPVEALGQRLIHFKFEPMILHVLTTSHAHAQLLLRAALEAGFRESGAINLALDPSTMPMVAVRCMGLAFDAPIGYEFADGHRCRLVSLEHLEMLMAIANQRFAENTKRVDRFRSAFLQALKATSAETNPGSGRWEDTTSRRDRMRAEGLLRQAELSKSRK